MVGAPSQLELFDYKPKLQEFFDKDLPDSIRMGQRITTMTSGQARFPIAPSKYKFAQHGKSVGEADRQDFLDFGKIMGAALVVAGIETVLVTAQSPLLEMGSASAGQVIDEKRIALKKHTLATTVAPAMRALLKKNRPKVTPVKPSVFGPSLVPAPRKTKLPS